MKYEAKYCSSSGHQISELYTGILKFFSQTVVADVFQQLFHKMQVYCFSLARICYLITHKGRIFANEACRGSQKK